MGTRRSTLYEDVEHILYDTATLDAAIADLGRRISADYAGTDLVVVGILKGALFFLADLIRRITIPLVMDFMAISSYGEATQTSGVARIVKDLEENIEGRHVLIVEEVVDSGLTAGYLLKTLALRRPASLKICALLDKPYRRILETPIHYKGLTANDEFLVGYGLDFKDQYRHLPFVCTLAAEKGRGSM